MTWWIGFCHSACQGTPGCCLPKTRAHTVPETKGIAHKRDRHMPLAKSSDCEWVVGFSRMRWEVINHLMDLKWGTDNVLYSSKCFPNSLSFNPITVWGSRCTPLCPFYRWGHWEVRTGNLPKVTGPVRFCRSELPASSRSLEECRTHWGPWI